MSDAKNVDLSKRLARAERDWESMQRICHDFFHGWRQTVMDRFGPDVAKELELSFYGRIGEGTARTFLERGGTPDDLAKLVRSLVRASEVMGEAAHLVIEEKDVLLVHAACPWMDSFRATDAPNQCQASCDHWFQSTAKSISPRIKVLTESALPAGGASCTRRFSFAQ
ncbi:L-2-amino-thiazoline-4-carboxylic acid hydrolase [Sulfuritalea sp.]|uniref:L-2-amino-thiazoline-4-carboxylic acid hydrolase n=1 Tax=Sulfuritalea sp. TaxID=2480090 RepID=UPI001AC2609A|nr:L-2-amino-thiazoline-4-carboxylic acid hydrolase [Sulfuritalea sp.]MBN8477095.1 L-2-amino-thiazoline-4-carboxylic acid hydrolase [Sulfuritalea sp.]